MTDVRRPAVRVRQWLPEWDRIVFDESQRQRKPEPYFYMVSLPAADLRRLAGVHRRDVSKQTSRAGDTNVQRRHDVSRSLEIKRFVKDGYPLSTMSAGQRARSGEEALRKPGWLPTALIVNVLAPGDERGEAKLASADAVTLELDGDVPFVVYPPGWDEDWRPEGVHPVEVIDGQHRLWAFDEDEELDFEFPVVAFFNLDISWQAYLFWSVNIKPKRINASLAFDLYPLLREQSWLTAGEGAAVYRETRAQELTEALWATPESPWFRRINMLGDTGVRAKQPVTQAAFVRSLTSTFVRPWYTARTTVGGLFGGLEDVGDDAGLTWTRTQQAGLLVFLWRALEQAIAESSEEWAEDLRETTEELELTAEADLAFASPYSLLSSDQGVRPILSIFNDVLYVRYRELSLRDYTDDEVEEDLNIDAVSGWYDRWAESTIAPFAMSLCRELAKYDWRNSKAPSLTADERRPRLAFRGSGGYKELRTQLIDLLCDSEDELVFDAAETVRQRT